MNVLHLTKNWIDGEVRQGWIMAVLGMSGAVSFVLVFRCHPELIRGLVVPAGLIVLALLGYGVNLIVVRPRMLRQFEAAFRADRSEFRRAEAQRLLSLKRSLATNRGIWIALTAVCCVTFFFVPGLTFKALVAGLALAFVSAFVIDAALEHRAGRYYRAILQED